MLFVLGALLFAQVVETTTTSEWDQGLVREDVVPTLTVFSSGGLELRFGGLIQVHAAPYAGEDALIENGDPLTRPGFRLRRARLGAAADLGPEWSAYLTINLVSTAEDDGIVSDAKIAYQPAEFLRLSAGLGKIPFSRGALDSSRALLSIDRPLSVRKIVPTDRVGLTAEGSILEGRFSYLAGVLNATPGLIDGDRFGGLLYGLRLEIAFLGPTKLDAPPSDEFKIVLGGGGFFENGPGANTLAESVDILATYSGASLQLEFLCDQRKPVEAPEPAPGLPSTIKRCGAYAEAAYLFDLGIPLQIAARGERFDDDLDVESSGDVLLISGGLNALLFEPWVRAQLHYILRRELHGPDRANDSLVFVIQGAF